MSDGGQLAEPLLPASKDGGINNGSKSGDSTAAWVDEDIKTPFYQKRSFVLGAVVLGLVIVAGVVVGSLAAAGKLSSSTGTSIAANVASTDSTGRASQTPGSSSSGTTTTSPGMTVDRVSQTAPTTAKPTKPVVPASKRAGPPYVITYWSSWFSDLLDLDEIPSYVDIVLIAFVTVKPDGNVTPSVGYYPDQRLKEGVARLQTEGKQVFLSVGGAGNCRDGLVGDETFGTAGVSNKFASSVASVVQKFGFDGVDIDYECYISNDRRVQNTANAVEATKALRSALPKTSLLTWAAFSSVFQAPEKSWADYTTTFRAVAPHLDMAFWMTYNIDSDVNRAKAWYSNALGSLPAVNAAFNNTCSKVAMSYCAGGGCGYGPGPDDATVLSWAQYVKQNHCAGIMLWDINSEKKVYGADFLQGSLSKRVADILHA